MGMYDRLSPEEMAEALKGDAQEIVREKRREMAKKNRYMVGKRIEEDLDSADMFEEVVLDDADPWYHIIVYHITLPCDEDTYYRGHRRMWVYKPKINLRKVPHRIKKVLSDYEGYLSASGYRTNEKPTPIYDKDGEYMGHDRDYYRIKISLA